MSKKNLSIIFVIIFISVTGWFIWNKYASPTKIALINFQNFQTTGIIRSNTDKNIKYEIIEKDDIPKLDKYNLVVCFGMGLQISAEQREHLNKSAEKGTPLIVFAPTNPENNICNLSEEDKENITAYLGNPNKSNYKNFARYVRNHIDSKRFGVTNEEEVKESEDNVFFHLDEDKTFKTASEYEDYLKSIGQYDESRPKVAIIMSVLNDPFSGNRENIDSMIVSFQNNGMQVYPIYSMMQRVEMLKDASPDAAVYLSHGRLAMGQSDNAVNYLKERNIPLFSALTVLSSKEEWMNDNLGMYGGFFSQSIVVPELDGAIYPYVISSQEKDTDGIYTFKSIPDRLNSFSEIVKNHLTLKEKSNSDKKLAIYFFKGPGKETLEAQGLETIPSLYNLLKRLKDEGYNVENLPTSVEEFKEMLMINCEVTLPYAEGAFSNFMKRANPELVEKAEYESWIEKSISPERYKDVVETYGEAPGEYLSIEKDGKKYLAIASIKLGNIALLPQPMAGLGSDEFAIIHGAKIPPPHTYIGAYLWAHNSFKADAMLHFGTHGSLEFTPQKQVALSSDDWSDRLVSTTPHFYYYTIGNVGESMMAKRRSYATVVSYITPAFMETEMRSHFRDLFGKIQSYYKVDESYRDQASLHVKKVAVTMGIHRELRMDSVLTRPYSYDDIERIENFAEEIAADKMNGEMYTTGVPYPTDKINSSVLAMCADPIAYSLAALDKQRGLITAEKLRNKSFFNRTYLYPAKKLVDRILQGTPISNSLICSYAKLTEEDIKRAKEITTPKKRRMGHHKASSAEKPHVEKEKKHTGDQHPGRPAMDNSKKEKAEHPHMAKAHSKTEEISKADKTEALAIMEIIRTFENINNYRTALINSPELELQGVINALNGGYTAPSSGGDPVANPAAVPTGKNLYSINAEATPTEVAWDRGSSLAQQTIETYFKQHGEYPRKVSYTFWSSEFIESEGTTIAQVLYMLGVRPVRDGFGRVSDIELIPSQELGRPRIDVVVQTSGQFRDLAASRLALITRAVEMASSAKEDEHPNLVHESVVETERKLVENGINPKDAREMSTQRVFGGVNGMYGTNIQEMITSSDKWEDEKEIADTYLHNMSAIYGSENNWGEYKADLLRTVLHNADVIIQPRQSNTWGALSLDHVYEFMGGLNLAIRNVTGKDPDAYFSDYRNRNNMRMQELKEAIGVEARGTIFNPTFVQEITKGGASSGSRLTEIVVNTFAWNVAKPDVIDNEMWDKLYEVYVKDSYKMNIKEFFEQNNPYALQEITAVMMETSRKGMWKASEQQLSDLASLHTELVKKHGNSGSGFTGGNEKLQQFISSKVDSQEAKEYNKEIAKMSKATETNVENIDKEGMVLKKEKISNDAETEENNLNGVIVVTVVLIAFVIMLLLLRRKRKSN